MFNGITNWESRKVQPVYWYYCGPGSEKTWTSHKERPSHQFADSELDKHSVRMISELTISKLLVLKCSNIREAGVTTRRRMEEELERISKRTMKSSHSRGYEIGVQSTLFVSGSEKCFQNKMPVQRKTPSSN